MTQQVSSSPPPNRNSEGTKRPEKFVFDLFEFHDWPPRLYREGEVVPLQPQPARCLELLLRKAGQVVEREEIREFIWGRETFLNHDQGINYIIKKLREALGDETSQPRFIETVPRRGYRFLPRVESMPLEDQASVRDEDGGSGRLAASRHWVWLPVLLLVALAAFWLRPDHPAPTVALQPLSGEPIAVRPGVERNPDLSRDGQHVLFSTFAADLQGWRIFVQPIEGGEPLRVTDGQGSDFGAKWSPDDSRFAFVRIDQTGRCGVVVKPILGGSEKQVADCGESLFSELTWSPDGLRIVYSNYPAEGSSGGLRMVDLKSGERSTLTRGGSEGKQDSFPAFSPDGRHLAFLRGHNSTARDLFVMDLPRGEPRRLTSDSAFMTGVAWSEDSSRLVFASNRVGLSALWTLPVQGGEPLWLPLRDTVIHDPTISGSKLAYGFWEIESELRQTDLATGETNRPWFAVDSWEDLPRFSPDGTQVAFVSHRSGSGEVWLAGEGQPSTRQLTRLEAQVIEHLAWSNDGTRLLVGIHVDGQERLFVVGLQSEEARPVGQPGEIDLASWTPQGQILFTRRILGQPEIWRLDPATDEVVQITDQGASSGRMVGERLTVTVPDAPGFWEIEVGESGREQSRRQVHSQGPQDVAHWDSTGDDLWYVDQGEGRLRLIVLSGDGFEVEVEVEIVQEMMAHSGVSLSPDRSTLLMAVIERLESDLYSVELPAELFPAARPE